MNRCLFVATDGSPAAHAAVCYAIELAAPLRINEIACLCVHNEFSSRDESIIPAIVGSEMALSTAAGGLMLLDQPRPQSTSPLDPESVLNACSRRVTAAGLRFTPVCGVGVPSDVIAQTSHIGEVIFLGRNSDRIPANTRRIGLTASKVLESIRQTILVCPLRHESVERLVIAVGCGPRDPELVARGATWATALGVPVHVMINASGLSFSTHAIRAAQTVLANEGLATSGECYSCRPGEYVQKLRATDLLLVPRSRLWRVVQFWFGSSTGRMVQSAPCPVAVIA